MDSRQDHHGTASITVLEPAPIEPGRACAERRPRGPFRCSRGTGPSERRFITVLAESRQTRFDPVPKLVLRYRQLWCGAPQLQMFVGMFPQGQQHRAKRRLQSGAGGGRVRRSRRAGSRDHSHHFSEKGSLFWGSLLQNPHSGVRYPLDKVNPEMRLPIVHEVWV